VLKAIAIPLVFTVKAAIPIAAFLWNCTFCAIVMHVSNDLYLSIFGVIPFFLDFSGTNKISFLETCKYFFLSPYFQEVILSKKTNPKQYYSGLLRKNPNCCNFTFACRKKNQSIVILHLPAVKKINLL
jgi:hypothetical protein